MSTNAENNIKIMAIINEAMEINKELSFTMILELLSINQTWLSEDSKHIINNTNETSKETLDRILRNLY